MLPRALRQAARGAGFAALTLGAGTGVWAGVTRAHGDAAKMAARNRWTRAWSRELLSLFGVDLVVEGDATAGLSPDHGRVIVANHRSIIDIAVLLLLFGGALVSRGDLEGWPLIGPAARAAGTIFVDRGNKKSGAQAIERMIARLSLHDTICLFPEGTTYVDDEVRPFKPGACVAATRARVPVVPVALVYPQGSDAAFGGESFTAHLARLAATGKTTVRVEVGQPKQLGEGESVEAFTERCRAEVARLLGVGRGTV
jgi:1-acyl-sn-glycerol-3-phosphate acyltransferase